jgi:indolepyruvate ferredoxin oxidoreductase
MSTVAMNLREVDLNDRYTASSGAALIGGTQALVRFMIEQRRLDKSRGFDTGIFVSGYPGSPLGGLDREIGRARRYLEPEGIVFNPGVNEELAATSVAGTQLVEELPGRSRDGVVGVWYGKAPGLDRAADAIRHGNAVGTSRLGGAVILVGDDPWCKSSTVPSSCEMMAESLMLPLFSPGAIEDIVRLGLHAVALSREANIWTAMKIIPDVADSAGSLDLAQATDVQVPMPPEESRGAPPVLLGDSSVNAEYDLMANRIETAREYGREHDLNRIVFEPTNPRVAVIAPGPSFGTLQLALDRLQIGPEQLEQLGVRLVRAEFVYPIHPEDVREFAAGVEEVIVVEDKRPFVERQIRDVLYGQDHQPRVIGKHDEQGRPFIAMNGAVASDPLGHQLARRWKVKVPAAQREAEKRAPRQLPMVRTPFFCSGCPHNLSTKADADQLVGAGIGCHSLIFVDPSGQRGKVLGAPQMGGEGAQWLGMAPFTSEDHYVQNMGDGTFHHSGSLAIRAAAAAGVNMTFRILYNDAIAMTGGQTPAGRIDVPELTRWLELEGVKKVAITTEDPESFAGVELSSTAKVHDRSKLDEVLADLGTVEGVTVLIHTDRCATEERRMRKRGTLPTPAERIWINERVCEGCGDCGHKSTCLSVVPVDTEFGRKTQIHQSSCTQDFACLEGDCPSFLVVTPRGGKPPQRLRPEVPFELPEPTRRFDDAKKFLTRLPGIGGTGVVTVSQVLQMAAILEGRWSSGIDQTGLAQKGGPVISDIRIAPDRAEGSLRAAAGEVDLLLGLDPLGAATPDTLRTLDRGHSIAIVNTHLAATVGSVSDPDAAPLPFSEIVSRVEGASRADLALWIDAGTIAERLFGDHMAANMVMLGAAYQHGCLPVGGEAIDEAIRLNGVGIETNQEAFAWGRAAALDPGAVFQAIEDARPSHPSSARAPLPAGLEAALGSLNEGDSLKEALSLRVAELTDYQDAAYAERYANQVQSVIERERAAVGPAAGRVAAGFATGLFKLMAYKDEYEVARLHLDSIEAARREEEFGEGADVSVMLHPPLLRAIGLDHKVKLRRTARPTFKALRSMRRLRGKAIDPFGYAKVRRVERALVDEYAGIVDQAMQALTPDTQEAVAAIAGLPDMIRGYEDIKLENVSRFREAAAFQLAELASTRERE